MAKTSRRRVTRYEKDHSGCMWSLINIFDFRHPRPTNKLISDRKHGSRRTSGVAYPKNKIQIVEDLCETCEKVNGCRNDETASIDSNKMSVKELMAEEMCGHQDQKKQTGCDEMNSTFPATGHTGHAPGLAQNRRRTSQKSFDLDEIHTAEAINSQRPAHQKHKSLSSLDLNVMVDQLFSRIDQKSFSRPRLEQEKELLVTLDDDSSVIEAKLEEATKVFVNHFSDGKSFTKDMKIQPSKELLDALQVLSSNKQMLLKLLQDPNSQLVKKLQEFQDSQNDNRGNSEVLGASELLQPGISHSKQHSFWRKFKGAERSSSKKNENVHEMSRIVVLRPGPTDSQLEDANTCSTLNQPQPQVESGNQTERSTSHCSFSEFRRKWRFGTRKEHRGIALHGPPERIPSELLSLRTCHKASGNEKNSGMSSPSRDHFFIEKIPKAFSGMKRVDKVGSPRNSMSQQENENEDRSSNIYLEARRHLAEIVGNSDVDVDFLSRQVPRSLGRILSFPGYISPICSPRKTGEYSVVAGEIRLSPRPKCDIGTEQRLQETVVSDPAFGERGNEGQSCVSVEKFDDEFAVRSSDIGTSKELTCELEVGKTQDLLIVENNAKGELVGATIKEAVVPNESTHLDTPVEPCTVSCIINKNNEGQEVQEEEEFSKHLDLDTIVESEVSCSTTTSPPRTKETEEFDATEDRGGQPSPISVLDPSFIDDISPSGTTYLSGIQLPQPRQIQFEETALPPQDQALLHTTSCEGSKNYMFEFVESVVQMSGLSWDELFRRSLFSDHIIEPSLFDKLDLHRDHLSVDPRLLFDLIDEVISDICWNNYGCTLSFANFCIRAEAKGKNITSEIWEGADWYLQMHGRVRTLEQVVAKDFAKPGCWMDLRFDIEDIDMEMEEDILEELVEDTISCCITQIRQESISRILSGEPVESGSDSSIEL